MLLQLLLHAVDVCRRQVDFVHRDNDADSGGLGVADRLLGLGHDAVVGSDHEDNDVRDVCAARAHRGESGVAGSVEESDFVSAMLHRISADVLRDATRLTRRDARLADKVHERSFAVVDMPHERDDRRTRFEFFLGDFDFGFGRRCNDRLGLVHAGTGHAFFFFENKSVLFADDRGD